MIEKMNGDLAKVIEDFDRAMNIESLRLVKETGERSLYQSCDSTS